MLRDDGHLRSFRQRLGIRQTTYKGIASRRRILVPGSLTKPLTRIVWLCSHALLLRFCVPPNFTTFQFGANGFTYLVRSKALKLSSVVRELDTQRSVLETVNRWNLVFGVPSMRMSSTSRYPIL